MMPEYCTGMSQPPKSTIRAPAPVHRIQRRGLQNGRAAIEISGYHMRSGATFVPTVCRAVTRLGARGRPSPTKPPARGISPAFTIVFDVSHDPAQAR